MVCLVVYYLLLTTYYLLLAYLLTESVVCLVVYYLLLTTYYSLLTTGLLTNRERGVLGRLVQVGLGLGAARLEIELGRGG